jgi:N-acetylmuramoyl-L-alanine amidase
MFLNNFLGVIRIGTVLLLAGCETLQQPAPPPRPAMPQYTRLPVSARPSPNFGPRRPNFIILHHTADNSAEESLRTLTTPRFEVSSHYLIGRDGTLYYLVDEMARAWHAGEGYWGGTTDLNSASIGIELDNNGKEPFAEPMIATLLLLLDELKTRYKIPTANFLAHGDIIPGRKVDPSRFFPWKRLAERGFGLWCEPPYPGSLNVPAGVNDTLLLAAYGYDVTNMRATAAAFRRRFLGTETEDPLTPNERALLQCLIERKRNSGNGL